MLAPKRRLRASAFNTDLHPFTDTVSAADPFGLNKLPLNRTDVPTQKRLCRNAYAKTPMQKRLCRNAYAEMPMQKRLRKNVYAETPMQKRLRRNAYAETPTQKCLRRNAHAETPTQRYAYAETPMQKCPRRYAWAPFCAGGHYTGNARGGIATSILTSLDV
ncbi:hypothetical protein LZ32DRAFT_623337 [Colletotrichum eremochloae]|nr:hypothetical protein LZ32DRAFT_623337 [Colletotrichum eremochloae]